MGVETRVLNLFLHKAEGVGIGKDKQLFLAGFNFTTQTVFSWEESLDFGGTSFSGSFNLGTSSNSKLISDSIRTHLSTLNPPQLISQVDLHNEGDYRDGQRGSLPEVLYHSIHLDLMAHPPVIKYSPKVYLVNAPIHIFTSQL